MCHVSKLSSSINDVINQNRGSKPLICAYCLSSRFITWKKNLRPRKGYLMASQRPIRRKPCSHANNFESLIAFRNTYIWGGGRDGGRRGGEGFSGCNMLVIFFLLFSFWFIPSISLCLSLCLSLSLSLSLSSSLTTTKKNAFTLHVRLNFFVFSSGKYEILLMKSFHLEMIF